MKSPKKANRHVYETLLNAWAASLPLTLMVILVAFLLSTSLGSNVFAIISSEGQFMAVIRAFGFMCLLFLGVFFGSLFLAIASFPQFIFLAVPAVALLSKGPERDAARHVAFYILIGITIGGGPWFATHSFFFSWENLTSGLFEIACIGTVSGGIAGWIFGGSLRRAARPPAP